MVRMAQVPPVGIRCTTIQSSHLFETRRVAPLQGRCRATLRPAVGAADAPPNATARLLWREHCEERRREPMRPRANKRFYAYAAPSLCRGGEAGSMANGVRDITPAGAPADQYRAPIVHDVVLQMERRNIMEFWPASRPRADSWHHGPRGPTPVSTTFCLDLCAQGSGWLREQDFLGATGLLDCGETCGTAAGDKHLLRALLPVHIEAGFRLREPFRSRASVIEILGAIHKQPRAVCHGIPGHRCAFPLGLSRAPPHNHVLPSRPRGLHCPPILRQGLFGGYGIRTR